MIAVVSFGCYTTFSIRALNSITQRYIAVRCIRRKLLRANCCHFSLYFLFLCCLVVSALPVSIWIRLYPDSRAFNNTIERKCKFPLIFILCCAFALFTPDIIVCVSIISCNTALFLGTVLIGCAIVCNHS